MPDIQNHNKHKGTYRKTNLKTRKLVLDATKTLQQVICMSWCTATSLFCVYIIQNCRYIKPNTAASSTEYTGENIYLESVVSKALQYMWQINWME